MWFWFISYTGVSFLLDWYRDQYLVEGTEKHAAGKDARLYQAVKGDWRLSISERRRILLAHIFGVDIDQQAVEVTKLSLLLKVLEGESADAIASQMDLFKIRALPDLASNIRCGNSLISSDFYIQFEMGLFTEEQMIRINTFDWEEFAFFSEAGGFDAVVGNPPYGATINVEEKAYFKKWYKYQSYQLDSYLLFIDRAISNLLKEGGMFGMIIPNPWLTNLNQTSLREFVVSRTDLREIVHFHFQVFARAKAIVDTEIVLLRNGRTSSNRFPARFVRKLSPEGSISLFDNEIEHSQNVWSKRAGQVFNIFLDDKRTKLASRILSRGKRLDQFFNINVGMKPYQVGKGKPAQTRADVQGRVFDSNTKTDPTYRQYLRGADIDRFAVAPQESRFIKYGKWLAEPRPSADFDAPVKLLVRQTGDSLIAAEDRHQYLCMNNMHVMVPTSKTVSTSYGLGILSSKLMNWYYRTLNPEMGEALAEVKKENVARLPIIPPCADNRKVVGAIETLVSRLNAAKVTMLSGKDEHVRKVAARTYNSAMADLNTKIYELYELSAEEVDLVERDEASPEVK